MDWETVPNTNSVPPPGWPVSDPDETGADGRYEWNPETDMEKIAEELSPEQRIETESIASDLLRGWRADGAAQTSAAAAEPQHSPPPPPPQRPQPGGFNRDASAIGAAMAAAAAAAGLSARRARRPPEGPAPPDPEDRAESP